MQIALSSDHAGYALKETIKARMIDHGFLVVDCGTYSADRVDYIDYTLKVVDQIANGTCGRGIFFCGNGYAMAMLANRFPGMRAAVCHDVFSARTVREMGNANIISLGARVVGAELAWDLIHTWLDSEFLGDSIERYARRQEKLDALDARFAQPNWHKHLQDYLSEQRDNE